MIKKSSRRKYRRLLIFYSLVIILPGTLLSVLAYRGINSNRIAEQKIREDRLYRKSRYFTASVDETIKTYLEAFSDNLLNQNSCFFSVTHDSTIQAMMAQGEIMAAASMDENGHLRLLDQTTLFVPDEFFGPNLTDGKPSITHMLAEAQSEELLNRADSSAYSTYERVLNTSEEGIFKVLALCGMARISIKEDLTRTSEIYNKLLITCEEYSHEPGLSSNLFSEMDMVWRNMIEFDMNSNKSLENLKALEVLSFIGMSHLLLPEYEYKMLEKSTMWWYANAVNILGISNRHRCDSIQSRNQAKVYFSEALSNQFPRIMRNLQSVQNSRRSTVIHAPYLHDSLSVVFSCKATKDGSIGLLLDIKSIMQHNFKDLYDTISFPKRIEWQLIDPYNSVFASSTGFDKEEQSYPLVLHQYGDWELKLQEESSSRFDMLNEAGQMIYFFVFLFVIIAMAIGLLLAIRSLTVEYRLSLLKSDFVSTVSHEFKSPLTSIRMMSERLSKQRVKSEDRKQEYYDSMLTQSDRLSNLVENILDFSRMNEGRKAFNFEACNITQIVSQVVEYMSIRNRDSGFRIEFEPEEDAIIGLVDSQGVHQVVFNLIDNAIKYSGDSNRITVNLESNGHEIIISVRDYGIGISKREKRRIFTRFYRSERVNVAHLKGTGIGLSIVKEIIRAHQGRIEVESEINKGSVFKVYLPLNKT